MKKLPAWLSKKWMRSISPNGVWVNFPAGNSQRVLLARALAQSTPILLLDEPTVHLDLQHQVNLMEIVRTLAHADHLAVLIALHDLNLAARYADRVALLVAGEVKAAGTAAAGINSGDHFGGIPSTGAGDPPSICRCAVGAAGYPIKK